MWEVWLGVGVTEQGHKAAQRAVVEKKEVQYIDYLGLAQTTCHPACPGLGNGDIVKLPGGLPSTCKSPYADASDTRYITVLDVAASRLMMTHAAQPG